MSDKFVTKDSFGYRVTTHPIVDLGLEGLRHQLKQPEYGARGILGDVVTNGDANE